MTYAVTLFPSNVARILQVVVMYGVNSNDVSVMQSNLEQITSLLEQLIAIDIQITIASASEIEGLLTQKVVFSNQIQSLVTINQTLWSNIQTTREGNATWLKVDNSSIGVLAIYEQNTKTINDIFLSKITIGETNFTPTQLIDLESIAMQCPLAGGSAVYKARSILLLLQPGRHFVDGCNKNKNLGSQDDKGQIGESYGTSKYFNLYPNPVKNELTINWAEADFEKGIVYIYNIYGETILQQEIVQGNLSHVLDVKGLTDGLYFIQLSIDEKPYSIKKFIVTK